MAKTQTRLGDKLTKKQRGFVEDYLNNDENATEAALNNYDTNVRNVARAIGTENMLKPAIKNEIVRRRAEIQQKAEEKTQITIESQINEYKQNIQLGRKFKQVSAANGALDSINKMLGYFAKDNAQTGDKTLVVVSDKERKVLRDIGLELIDDVQG